MAGSDWMIYGANGYAGALMVEHAISRGFRPVIAGRRELAIKPVAERYGLTFRTFDITNTPAAVRELHGIGTLLLAAGPFSVTSAPAIDACLASQTNYLDITGEIAVFEAAQRRNAYAKVKGIVVLPGTGFDVVPSDCLALALHRALPQATHLKLAIALIGKPGPGSLKTALEGAAEGGWVRRAGTLTKVPTAWRSLEIPFAHGRQWAMTIPWGDVSTAYWSTRIPNIEVYMATPRAAIWTAVASRPAMRVLKNESVQRALKGLIDAVVTGGNEQVREAGKSYVWGRVDDGHGNLVEGNLQSMETTMLTAHTAVDIAVRVQRGEVASGYTTPSLAFGADYIRTFPATHLSIGVPQ